jgi:hypothetical protein
LNGHAWANQTDIPVSAIEINPQNADILDGANAHREKSRFYNTLGRNQWMADERYYSQLFTQKPSQSQATDAYNLALKHWEFGHVAHTKYWVQKEIIGQPQNVLYLKLWLQVLLKQTDPIALEAQFNKAMATEPINAHQACFLKALLFDTLGQWGLACQSYQLYQQLYPESLLSRYATERIQLIASSHLESEPQAELWE